MEKINTDNQEVYNSKHVVSWYSKLRELMPAEKLIFEKYKLLIRNGSVLDIGIGGGRTTSFLFPITNAYTGIDYSENFIKEINKMYPGINCLVMDARDLSAFKNDSFDLVNFSFNGIDYVDLEGRKKILVEVLRVLKPGGLFFFSTHNKKHPKFNLYPWLDKNNSTFVNIKTFFKLVPFFFRKLKQKKQEVHLNEFAIINDSAHNYSLMTFYTSPEFLRKQLSEENFEEVRFYKKSGEESKDENLDDWIFVSAKKNRSS